MLESLISLLADLPPSGVLLLAFLVAYIENLFPPSPSDVLLVFLGTMVGLGIVEFPWMIVTATLGSSLGFATAYALGKRYGIAITSSRWVPFITPDLIAKVEGWFDKYHGLIIVANRFLAGTRAVIAFAAGIVRLPLPRTLLYCTLSALLWNSILIAIGMYAGANWRAAEPYLTAYGWAVTGLIATFAIVWLVRRKR